MEKWQKPDPYTRSQNRILGFFSSNVTTAAGNMRKIKLRISTAIAQTLGCEAPSAAAAG
jgi:hypothetical protein